MLCVLRLCVLRLCVSGSAKGQGTVMLLISLVLVLMGSVAWGGTPGNEDYDQSYGQV
jgi:hypothetical protein